MNDIQKYLFLDVDSVLNTWQSRSRFGLDYIDQDKVSLIGWIVRATGCKVVLSSTWRVKETDYNLVERALKFTGVELYGATPIYADLDRGDEIAGWLGNQKGPYIAAVLDDWEEADPVLPCTRLFLTNDNQGLTVLIAKSIIDFYLGGVPQDASKDKQPGLTETVPVLP